LILGTTLSGTTGGPLRVESLAVDQTRAFYAFVEKNRDQFIDTIPFVAGIRSERDLRKLVHRNVRREKAGLSLFWTLWAGEAMVGYYLVREFDLIASWAEIGYMLDRDWQGRGVTVEACRRILSYLFDVRNMNKAVICCNDDNGASIAIARKLGFTPEGVLRNHFVVNGRLRNLAHFGLLSSERA